MRVGIIVGGQSGGGAEAVARAWARYFARAGDDVVLYAFLPGRFDETLDNLTWRRYPFGGALSRAFGLPLWVGRRSKCDEIDVLLGVGTYANVTALLGRIFVRSQTSIVGSEHSIPSLYRQFEGPVGKIHTAMARRLYRLLDGVIAVSHATATDLLVGYHVQRDRCYVVPNPVLQAEPKACTAEPTSGGPKRVAFVSRLAGPKRPLLFVEVLAALVRRGVPLEGLVIGDGPLRERMEGLAEELQVAVIFRDWTPDWAYESIDCLLLPSQVEGLGMILVEAAFHGIPVVAPSLALGVADAVIPGATGVLVDGDNIDDYADAVEAAFALVHSAPPGWLARWSSDHSGRTARSVLQRAVGEKRTTGSTARPPASSWTERSWEMPDGR